jgi:hypothetical protein
MILALGLHISLYTRWARSQRSHDGTWDHPLGAAPASFWGVAHVSRPDRDLRYARCPQ